MKLWYDVGGGWPLTSYVHTKFRGNQSGGEETKTKVSLYKRYRLKSFCFSCNLPTFINTPINFMLFIPRIFLHSIFLNTNKIH